MRSKRYWWGLIPTACVVVACLWGCRPSPGTRPSERADAAGPTRVDAAIPESADAQPGHEAGPSGKAVFAENEADLGDVLQGERVSHVFKVRNEGEGVLHIKNVRGS